MSTNLILIDSNLKDTDVLLSASNAQTIGILYNYDTSRSSILQQIDAAFSVKTIERLAICCHEGVNQFLENGTFFDIDNSTNEVLKNENTQFILDLLMNYNVSNIDFLACSSLKYDSWKKYYNLIESELEGVTVGASEDETGNLKYGGNWVLENTGEQVDTIYFGEGIEYYTYLFVRLPSYGMTNIPVRYQNNLWGDQNTTINVLRIPKTVTNIGYECYTYMKVITFIMEPARGEFTAVIRGSSVSAEDYRFINMPTNSDYSTTFYVFDENYNGYFKTITRSHANNIKNIKSYLYDFYVSENSSSFTQISRNITDVSLGTNIITEKNVDISVIVKVDNPCYNVGEFISFEHDDSTFVSSMITISNFFPYNNDLMNKEWIGYISTSQEIFYENIKLKINSTNSFETTFTVDTRPPPPTLDFFQINPTDITVENHGTINMTFSDDRITLTDISNSLTVDPSNAGVIDNINETSTGTTWTADFTPNYGLDLTDCSLNFNHSTYGINEYSNIFNIETHIQQIKSVILAPENIITDLSSNLEVILRVPTGTTEPTITIDPSYIANLDGNMTSSDGGLTWNGSINRTPGMNLLGNTLTVASGDLSSNIAFDVVEQDIYINSSDELIRFVKPIANVSNIEYPNDTSNFQINFTTNDKTLDDISGNVSLTSSVSNIDTSSLALTNYGFRLEGNIVADPYSESNTNKITYFETVDISGESANFTINTIPVFGLIGCTLTPENLVDTDVSATLRIEFNTPLPADTSLNNYIDLDPSYIATMGTMSDVSSGFVWEGVLTRTPNMNKLGNKLDFDFSYNGVEVSANLVYDVVENAQDNMWSLINSNTVNKEFNQSIQMSPNGLLMGLIDGSNVAIYRKSGNWVHDASYNGNSFALTNNHIVLANDEFLQIYDYSGTSWSMMNGGNIEYSNIIALSINVDGNMVAISNNSDVKVLQNISGSWTHINSYNNASVNGLSLSPNGLKLGMGIGIIGQDYSSIMVKDVVNNYPPVITLLGDNHISIEKNTEWVEPGYTAFDNLDGDISNNVVITGTVNVSIVGVYTLYYDVSDDNDNVALRKTRTVAVEPVPPVWSIPGTDILELSLFKNKCDLLSERHLYEFTLSGQEPYLNGDYIFETSSYRSVHSKGNRVLLDDNLTLQPPNYTIYFESCYNSSFTHTSFGTVKYLTKPYDSNGNYTGSDTNNASINPAFYSQLCNDANTYNGEYIEVKFPFLIQFSNIYLGGIVNGNTKWFPDDTVLLALKNDGTYDFITRYTDTNIDKIDHNMLSTQKYKGFKFIFVKCGSATENGRRSVIFDTLKCYGDIYTSE